MGEALRRDAEARGGGRRALAHVLAAAAAVILAAGPAPAQGTPVRLDRGRFTAVAYPSDLRLARAILDRAAAADTFPGLPRPRQRVLVAIAPDARRFREWVGPDAPEWGAAIAIPAERRIVMQGSDAGSDAGDPRRVLRHELAHLALHEYLGDLPPRWFDEGYASFAAGEVGRDAAVATSVALVVRGVPPLDSLDGLFEGPESQADAAYTLAYRAVAELSALDPERGLSLFLQYWKETGSMDMAMRRAYGLTETSFEQRWRDHAAYRYGALAVLANLTLALGMLGVLVAPLWLLRRRRDRERLAAMRDADDAAERAAHENALDALLTSAVPKHDAPDTPAAP